MIIKNILLLIVNFTIFSCISFSADDLLSDLPKDMLLKILIDVPEEARSINTCCKKLKTIMDDSEIFEIFYPHKKYIFKIIGRNSFFSFTDVNKPHSSLCFKYEPKSWNFQKLAHLTKLEIWTDIKIPFSIFPNLLKVKYMTLRGNNFENPEELGEQYRLPVIESLSITQNNLSSAAAHNWIKSQTNLKTLYLDANQLGSDEGVDSLVNLTTLFIDFNKLGNEGVLRLTSLTNLNTLNLNNNDFDLSILTNFTALTNLQHLYISGNNESRGGREAVEHLKSHISGLTVYENL